MNKSVLAIAILLLVGTRVCAAEFDMIMVEGSAVNARGVILSLPFEQGDDSLSYFLENTQSGNSIPTTIHNATLVAVIDYVPAGSRQEWTLSTKKRKRKQLVSLKEGRAADSIDVRLDASLFTTYHYASNERKSFLWPLNSSGELGMTRDYPMGERVKSRDHEHHQSFWTAYGHVNDTDLWEYNERTGWQSTEEIAFGSGGAMGWIESRLNWNDAQHKPVLREDRSYRFYNTEANARFFDLTVKLTAAYGEVFFKDTKEGGFASFRIHDNLRESAKSGVITNSEGGLGSKECWGKSAAWVDYSGQHGENGVRGITIFDHPDSFRYPTYWHARDYGLVAANPFGLSDFTDGELNGDYTLLEGESIQFKYRVYIHTGTVDEAEVAEYFNGFASPPVAKWSE